MEQRATVRRRRPRPSAIAALEPTIQVESLYDIARELTPLFVKFWKESGRKEISLDPDWSGLLRLTAAGSLRVVTIRDAGCMVGFMLNVVQPHPFYKSTLHGTTIAYWLDPLYRSGWFPVKFLRRNIAFLREWGCKRIFIAADLLFQNGRAGALFKRVGYEPHEMHYAMVLTS